MSLRAQRSNLTAPLHTNEYAEIAEPTPSAREESSFKEGLLAMTR